MEESKIIKDKVISALDGRKIVWLLSSLHTYAETLDAEENLEVKYRLGRLSQSTLSQKLNGYDKFKPYELKAISKILKIKF